jgi:hypothetical protein
MTHLAAAQCIPEREMTIASIKNVVPMAIISPHASLHSQAEQQKCHKCQQ